MGITSFLRVNVGQGPGDSLLATSAYTVLFSAIIVSLPTSILFFFFFVVPPENILFTLTEIIQSKIAGRLDHANI